MLLERTAIEFEHVSLKRYTNIICFILHEFHNTFSRTNKLKRRKAFSQWFDCFYSRKNHQINSTFAMTSKLILQAFTIKTTELCSQCIREGKTIKSTYLKIMCHLEFHAHPMPKASWLKQRRSWRRPFPINFHSSVDNQERLFFPIKEIICPYQRRVNFSEIFVCFQF